VRTVIPLSLSREVKELTAPEQDHSGPFVHPTAVVEEGAEVGKFTKIWFFSHVAPGAVIGENCSLGQNTYVERNAIVGNACRLGNSVSIYSHVELEDFVFCAPYMVFTHISFPRAAINRHAVFQKTLVKTGSTLGANSTVVPNVTCGVGTFLAAGATLTKNSRDWSMMVGSRRVASAGSVPSEKKWIYPSPVAANGDASTPATCTF
jgi:UDP-2-acetamido-3-amino-2,3-dideoxy-glucuronate N-acetyltransferase